jgi:hypothetical protein
LIYDCSSTDATKNSPPHAQSAGGTSREPQARQHRLRHPSRRTPRMR